jgi:hypothetical protein
LGDGVHGGMRNNVVTRCQTGDASCTFFPAVCPRMPSGHRELSAPVERVEIELLPEAADGAADWTGQRGVSR